LDFLHGLFGKLGFKVSIWCGVGGFRRVAAFLQHLARADLCVVSPINQVEFALREIRNQVSLRP
jgi:hypothetical protein